MVPWSLITEGQRNHGLVVIGKRCSMGTKKEKAMTASEKKARQLAEEGVAEAMLAGVTGSGKTGTGADVHEYVRAVLSVCRAVVVAACDAVAEGGRLEDFAESLQAAQLLLGGPERFRAFAEPLVRENLSRMPAVVEHFCALAREVSRG